jgi:hypothetical protein
MGHSCAGEANDRSAGILLAQINLGYRSADAPPAQKAAGQVGGGGLVEFPGKVSTGCLTGVGAGIGQMAQGQAWMVQIPPACLTS